ncbi:hypothetical protein SAMN05660653_00946 [Desulfonatronum thiosulfatophilum]|uniref:Uncharacterized protein n=1 Tax=Desulfonatronum thiosulfatophilum TaxID=617002 RepID=A0A1G6BEA4_9BACT|nr:hypothetical protein SAMN05660653_00946 [Desulfonatronum thiosulfatophilum]
MNQGTSCVKWVGAISLIGLLPVFGFIKHRRGDNKLLCWLMGLLLPFFFSVFGIEPGKLAGL